MIGYQDFLRSLRECDLIDYWAYQDPGILPRLEKQGLKDQQEAFLGMLGQKLEEPEKPLRYHPDYLR